MDLLLARDGQRALVVENEFLIGAALAEQLEALGFEADGPFPTRAAALVWLASHTPTVAILDIVLMDGDCLELARELRRKGVPILFYTGVTDWKPFRGEFAGAHVLRKPVAHANLVDALSRLLGGAITAAAPT